MCVAVEADARQARHREASASISFRRDALVAKGHAVFSLKYRHLWCGFSLSLSFLCLGRFLLQGRSERWPESAVCRTSNLYRRDTNGAAKRSISFLGPLRVPTSSSPLVKEGRRGRS